VPFQRPGDNHCARCRSNRNQGRRESHPALECVLTAPGQCEAPPPLSGATPKLERRLSRALPLHRPGPVGCLCDRDYRRSHTFIFTPPACPLPPAFRAPAPCTRPGPVGYLCDRDHRRSHTFIFTPPACPPPPAFRAPAPCTLPGIYMRARGIQSKACSTMPSTGVAGRARREREKREERGGREIGERGAREEREEGGWIEEPEERGYRGDRGFSGERGRRGVQSSKPLGSGPPSPAPCVCASLCVCV